MQQINLCNPFASNKLLPLIGEDFNGILLVLNQTSYTVCMIWAGHQTG